MKKTLMIVLLASLLAACNYADTPTAMVGLHYEDGAFESRKYVALIEQGVRKPINPGDVVFYYPIDQRTYRVTDQPGAGDTPTADKVTMNLRGAEVSILGQMLFKLNRDEETLRSFHEELGYKYNAYADDTGNPSALDPGWNAMLQDVIRPIINSAALDAARSYDSLDELMVNQAGEGTETFETRFSGAFAAKLDELGYSNYFCGPDYDGTNDCGDIAFAVERVIPPQQYVDQGNAREAAVARLQAAEANADAVAAEVDVDRQRVDLLGQAGFVCLEIARAGQPCYLGATPPTPVRAVP